MSKNKKINYSELKPIIIKYLQDQKKSVFLLTLVIFVTMGLQLMSPQIIRAFIDSIIEGASKDKLYMLALFFIGISLMQQLLAVASTYLSQNIGWKATNRLRTDLARHCLNLDMSFHKEHLPGELIERIDGDVTTLMNLFSNFMITILGNILLLSGVLVVLFYEDWRIGLSISLFSIVSMIFLLKISTIAVPYWKKVRAISSDFYGFLGEHISNREDVQSSGAKEYIFYKFHNFLKSWYSKEKKAGLLGYSMWTSSVFVFALGTMISFGLGGYLWQKGIITLGTVYLIFNYTELIRRPLEQIRMQLEDLQKAGAGINRINELLDISSKIKYENSNELSKESCHLSFENVDFGYEEEQKVLTNLSFELQAGEVMGLLGRTGSGKTTIGRLLLRLYDKKGGKILFDGKDIKNISQKSLRSHVAIVTQDVELFYGTIRDNLTFFNSDVGDDRIISAFKTLGLYDWFQQLEQGLDTVIQSNNSGLSAGEAQLLAFVRILLREPGLIILDEASSMLDPATEVLLEKAIKNLLKNRTAIIIAHRLQTVEQTDKILILEDGRGVEYGEREKLLMDKKSKYNQLLKVGLEEVLV